MIILILGGIGSGKTLTAVREIIESSNFSLTNFKLKNFKNYRRLQESDIIIKSKDKKDWKINWEFWENIRKEKKNYSIFLDEVHNIIHSRASMSKRNVLMSKWVSQIRKMLSDSPNNHLYIISQTYRKVDVDFRELSQIVILCKKFDIGGKVLIVQYYYEGIDNYLYGICKARKLFTANKYFKYYDSTELIDFSDTDSGYI